MKELIGGVVEMQEPHQFWHAGLGDGVVRCSLWAKQKSYGVAFTRVQLGSEVFP